MKGTSSFKFFFLILALLVLTSCAGMINMRLPRELHAYEGPHFPKDKLGYLFWNSFAFGKNLALMPIVQIDGRTWEEMVVADGFNPTIHDCRRICLPAGEHIIEMRGGMIGNLSGYSKTITGGWLLKFPVEPGHHYKLEYKKLGSIKIGEGGKKAYEITVHIKDIATKKIVSEVIEE